MKKTNKIVVCIVTIIVALAFAFLLNFSFFSSPKVYTLADGTNIEYYETKCGNTYVFENFKMVPVAIPVGK